MQSAFFNLRSGVVNTAATAATATTAAGQIYPLHRHRHRIPAPPRYTIKLRISMVDFTPLMFSSFERVLISIDLALQHTLCLTAPAQLFTLKL